MMEVEEEMEAEGGITNALIIEYILDADRMQTFGRMTPEELKAWKALSFNQQEAIVKKVVGR